MLSGGGLASLVQGIAPPDTVGSVKAANTAPTVAQGITVNNNLPVTGKTASLSVLASDDGGLGNLVYKWSVTASPTGGTATFGANGTNAASNTTATFTEAGAYTLSVKIVDSGNLSVSTTKTVTVTPTAASIRISTAAGQVVTSGSTLQVTGVSQALVAQGLDQFGNVMAAQPALVWSTTSLPASATAPSFTTSKGVTTVTFAMSGHYGLTVRVSNASSISSAVAVNVTPPNTAPTVAQPISVNGNAAVTGKTASVSVLGSDDGGEANLVYNWSVTASPVGGNVTFGLNGTNGAKNTVATFNEAGSYTLSMKIVDSGGLSVTTTKTVTVTATLTTLRVSTTAGQVVASSSTLEALGVSQLLVAQGLDQFGNVMATQPTLAWSTTSLPLNAAAPTFTTSNGVTKVTFAMAGRYSLAVGGSNASSVSSVISVNVDQTLTSIVLSPNAPSVYQGAAQQFTAKALDQFGQSMVSQQTFTWSASGGTINTTGLFTAPGTGSSCTVTVKSGSVAGTAAVTLLPATNVVQTLTSIVLSPNTTSVYQGAAQQFTAEGLDQFGQPMAIQPALTWSVSAGTVNTIGLFTAPGTGSSCTVTVKSGSVTGTAAVTLLATPAGAEQTLTSIVLSPNTPSVLQGATQQFTAKALDQFGQPMANQQAFTWSVNGGTISTAGLLTAPAGGSSCTVTVKSGKVTGTATVTLLANVGTLQDAALAKLVASLDADGSISRQDMIQILDSVAADGAVSATDFTDLKEILYQATALNIPAYVQALAGDVINGSFANVTYQSQALGNLTVGSSAAQLYTLIGKWFLGTDHPGLCNSSLVYTSTAGSLFPQAPSHADEYQGSLGDCYFISALGTLADSNPAAVENMFINNGDGTYTVRFYTGTYGTIYNPSDGSIGAGFNNNVGTADYVTVDAMLPAGTSGTLAYADAGASCTNAANSLWIPLAEKAYAQWNQTGRAGRNDQNAYASIQGGWMATVDAQVLGYNATDYIMTNTKEQVAVSALAAKEAVTIGTLSWSGTEDGLYPSHAYAITGYNASADTFTLYNPWGTDQPGQLTWSQLQATCSQMAVANASNSAPISGLALAASPSAAKGMSPPIVGAILASNDAANAQRTHAVSPAAGGLAACLVDAALT